MVAEELSRHRDLVFADPGLPGDIDGTKTYEFSVSRKLIERFIEHVNDHHGRTGLDPIPSQKIAPHMFRKTMSMSVGTEPGAEIALGLQPKHAATRALATRHPGLCRVRLLLGQPAGHRDRGRPVHAAAGPLRPAPRRRNDRLRPRCREAVGTFDAVREAATEVTRTAKTGGKRIEYDLLHKTRVILRFGKLNHCAFDQNNPDGAKCIEEAILPAGHSGPLIDRCQPGRCHNSVITPGHLMIWRSEETSLLTLLDTPKIAPCRHEQLDRQLHDVRSVIRRAQK
ncbi:hypothetical protein [Streptomyces sp. 4F14]|uniref:hypothetical protein n=1 Tax=Streptomyces sp. 4F14 TaxID=3394380 RepID=UPI003A8374F0